MKRILRVLGPLFVLSWWTMADAIPEPGIVLYGNVTNANRALRSGFLTIEFTGPNSKVVRVTTQLNANGPYGYRLRVPFESVVGGNTLSPQAYTLDSRTTTVRLSAPAGYSTAPTNSFAASFSLANVEISLPAGERALVREVNFSVATTLPTAGPIRLAEARIPVADSGQGSGSVEPAFQFTSIAATQEPGILVEWTGAPVNRGYYLLRTTGLDTTVDQSELVRYFPASPLTANWFWDTNTVDTTAYFYRLLAP